MSDDFRNAIDAARENVRKRERDDGEPIRRERGDEPMPSNGDEDERIKLSARDDDEPRSKGDDDEPLAKTLRGVVAGWIAFALIGVVLAFAALLLWGDDDSCQPLTGYPGQGSSYEC